MARAFSRCRTAPEKSNRRLTKSRPVQVVQDAAIGAKASADVVPEFFLRLEQDRRAGDGEACGSGLARTVVARTKAIAAMSRVRLR